MNKIIITTILSATAFLNTATAVSAEPNFGTCLNPQWSLSQENYSSNAQHGVVGVGGFAGTDKIYKSGSDVLQCLCTPEGKGYETKWMKSSDLSESEVKTYQNSGWISVTTGASYGLEDAPYLAKNSAYSCKESKIAGDSAINTINTPSAITTLAKTGNMEIILGFLLTGVAFLIGGIVLKRFSK